MTPDSRSGGSVLIVDADPEIRRLIAYVLAHAGFSTVGVDDLQDATTTVLNPSTFTVIVRDLNLAPAALRRSLQQLAETAPELLQRTVVTTTASARAETVLAAGTVFAIVSKPFDIETLVNAVRACARRTASPRPSRREPETEASGNVDSLQRFARIVPSLRDLLSAPGGCQREAALGAEMRRTLGTLAATLTEAAHGEASRTRAAVFRAASTVATRLAAPVSSLAARDRDH
ncbi:MAG TPA: response regulator [Thermoanaerobaculia bacterium]|nr:response regulator [Thermoanaerobaculia bacterium]